MKKLLFLVLAVACSLFGFATAAQAQLCVDSLSGSLTQNEINCFNTFMQGQSAPADNTGDGYGHHTDAQRFDALGLMYVATHDQGILDSYIRFVDTALHGRNNPTTGCIAWTGNRELFWPTSVNSDGTCGASTNGEQGWVISHQAWAAELILRTPALWNQTVTGGDPFGFGATYLDRAKTYVRELDRSEDTYILKNFVTNNQWRFPSSTSGYNGSTWFGLPFPWNQQMMLSGVLIRLANCHIILGDDPARVTLYNSIVQESWNFWKTTDLNAVTFQGHSAYTWHYVNQTAPNTSIENTGHAGFDMWGLYMLTLGSGRYGVDDATMTKFANTTAFGMDLGSSWAQNIDGTGATQTNLQPQFFLLAKWIPSLYTRIGNSDLSNAQTTPIYTAGLLWAKNAQATGCWNDAGCGASGDFALSALPTSQTVVAGNSTSYTVSVTPSGGFTGTVGLSVSGAPSGVTATLSPTSIGGGSGSSTLSISTSSSAATGTFTLTITGASGTLSHSATASLTVTPPPNFSLSATPASQTVTAGGPTSYTVSVSPANGFSSAVGLSVSGAPSGVTATLSMASIGGGSGSSTLNVTTTAATAANTYTLTITGSSGSLSHTATVSLVVHAVSAGCVTAPADAAWHNTAIGSSKTGTFTATFDATPSVAGQSSAVGLSHGAQTAYSGFANLAVFTTTGVIQAYNGTAYTAASSIPFSAGNAYHFRLAVNVTAHTYSIFVTPPGGSELTVGSNFAFRSSQNTVTSLDTWGALVNTTPGGTLQVCNFTAQ